jgi:hypothetical protein
MVVPFETLGQTCSKKYCCFRRLEWRRVFSSSLLVLVLYTACKFYGVYG